MKPLAHQGKADQHLLISQQQNGCNAMLTLQSYFPANVRASRQTLVKVQQSESVAISIQCELVTIPLVEYSEPDVRIDNRSED